MTTFVRIIHPIFSWGLFVFLGLEAIQRQLALTTVIVALGLAGLSQNFWKSQLSSKQHRANGDLISFGLGLLAAITYPLVMAWHFLYPT
ncbi:MAG: hypothetical protein V4488_16780 [Pseudomonadota bacterium]